MKWPYLAMYFVATSSRHRHHHRFPHRHKLLRRRGVDANRAVKHRFGGAGFHRHGEALHHLTRVGADHVQADDSVCRVFHHQLHQRALAAAAQSVLERFEIGFEDRHLAEFLAGVKFRITHRADVRVGC